MLFSAVLAGLLSVAAVSAQQTITVIVGGNGTLTYNPTSVMANVGDTLSFQFQSKNHTVTQSTFANPCEQMTTPTLGIDSGFAPVAADATTFPVWSFTMTNASAPLWFYCKQVGHCAKGMVFAVNPTAEKNFTAFQAAAMATGSNTTSTPAASGSSSASGSAAAAASTGKSAASGAARVAGGAAGALAAVGLAAGLLL